MSRRTIICWLAGAALWLGFSAPAAASYLWPELRFGRLVAVAPATAATATLGAAMGVGDLAGRVGAVGQLGLGYSGVARAGLSWQAALFGVEAGRDRQRVGDFGHGRGALAWARDGWALAAGADFWIDGGLASWLDAPSPWGALGWRDRRLHLGATFTWDRSDELATTGALASWAERRMPGWVPTATVGAYIGPVDLMASYTLRLDGATLAEDALAVEARLPVRLKVGRLQPYAVVRQPVAEGRSRYKILIEAGVRINFHVRTIMERWTEEPDSSDAQPFDPFS